MKEGQSGCRYAVVAQTAPLKRQGCASTPKSPRSDALLQAIAQEKHAMVRPASCQSRLWHALPCAEDPGFRSCRDRCTYESEDTESTNGGVGLRDGNGLLKLLESGVPGELCVVELRQWR